ncbi:Uncharacterised protein [Mycobacteroides abscessus subsp. abscessus]|nr:Uncharacterised protein [Mycobacteroides abscessus subsp. abscessus]
MLTIAATGHRSSACWMNTSSGSVNSELRSLTISMTSASGSKPSVLDKCGCPKPPTPGVSTRHRPLLSMGLATLTSTLRTSRPCACGARLRSLPISATGIGMISGSPASPPPSYCSAGATTSAADGCSP